MKTRMVILTLPTLGALIRDYLGDQVPDDAVAVQMLVNPRENGKLGFVLSSPSLKAGQEPKRVMFDIRRNY